MARSEEPKQSPPPNPRNPSPRDGKKQENGVFSPRFRSVAEMAGWDEEALLIASLIVEDTPDRDLKQKKRSDLQFKTPPTNSRRKRRAQRKSPIVVSMPVLDLEDDEIPKEEGEEKKIESKEEKNPTEKETIASQKNEVPCSSSGPQCMDRLREELSCAICLEICYEPSTTSCGHSFCKKCLRSAAEKCGKRCPKCRQLISSGRSCTVNTVLWNTIQLLFPQEVEARKAVAGDSNPRKSDNQNLPRASHYNARNGTVLSLNSPESVGRERLRRVSVIDGRNRSIRPSGASARDLGVGRRRRVPSQDEDAALALRLQREEFMDAFRGSDEQSRNSLSFARENLRAMASRAVNIRAREGRN